MSYLYYLLTISLQDFYNLNNKDVLHHMTFMIINFGVLRAFVMLLFYAKMNFVIA